MTNTPDPVSASSTQKPETQSVNNENTSYLVQPPTPRANAVTENTIHERQDADAGTLESDPGSTVPVVGPHEQSGFSAQAASNDVSGSSPTPEFVTESYATESEPVNSQHSTSQATQVTTPLQPITTAHGSGASAAQAPEGAAFGLTPTTASPRKGKAGIWVAGIAIGAVLGGVVGGGTAALMQSQTIPVQSAPVQGSSITLNNTDTVSTISAVAAIATPSVVTLQVNGAEGSGSGSGVIYSADGYIITNSHVATLSGSTAQPEIRVRLSDGTMLDAELVGTDPFADIAVVKVDATDLTPIAIADSAELNVGQTAIAIGAPLNLANTVTGGIVSALNRGISVANSMVPESTQSDSPAPENQNQGQFPWDYRFELPQEQPQQSQQTSQSSSRVAIPVLQTDASINPGNSGGALLNDAGELIGINVALAANDASSGTAGSDGLGFAIPSNLAVRVADSLIAGEQPSHGKLGVSVVESTQDTDEDALREGALIADLPEGSAAGAAGLKIGDVITAINDMPVNSSTAASALIRYHEGGSTVKITYSRGGELDSMQVQLDTLTW